MRRLPNSTKMNISKSSKYRKKKPEKANLNKGTVNDDEWAFLEWTGIESPKDSILE